MEVIRARFSGMCFGVRDALAAATGVEHPRDVTILGELVHNPEVLARLAARGFAQVPEDEQERVPDSPEVMITAHGVS